MNNDIKEILDYLTRFNDEDKYSYSPEYLLDTEEIWLLYDYITNLQTIERQYSAILSENAELENKTTNLQQDNEYLKKQNDDKTRIGIADHKYASQMEDKVIELQQDNEKIGKLWREEEAHCILLQQENERLKDDFKNDVIRDVIVERDGYLEQLEDYKSRCEEASEDIKDIFKDEKWYENYEYNDLENALKNVLNRLQNGSEDNE